MVRLKSFNNQTFKTDFKPPENVCMKRLNPTKHENYTTTGVEHITQKKTHWPINY